MKKLICLAVVCMMAAGSVASADILRGGIDMDFVTIGNPGNAGDTGAQANPYNCGAVSYGYRIGMYEVTAAQWQTINTAAGIGDPGYWSGNQPVAEISWYDAAQFCNYLTSGNKYSGAYKFDISGNFLSIDRVSSTSTYGTTYVIPTEDEWYKAAYFKPNASGYSLYANGTSTAPVAGVNSNYDMAIVAPWDIITNGTPEQNGTFDMMGNVWEWNETTCGYVGYENSPVLGIRGGSWVPYSNGDGLKSSDRGYIGRESEYYMLGFRVASIVPEPASLTLLFLGGMLIRKHRKKHLQSRFAEDEN